MKTVEGHKHTRRSFLEESTRRIATVGIFSAWFRCLGMAYQNKPGPALASVRISESRELEKVGGFVLVKDTPEGDLLIVRTGAEQYSALSNECPHKQCLVEVKSPVLIQCPCHKSAYRIDGTFVKGPAKTSLRKFPLQVEGDLIVVTKG